MPIFSWGSMPPDPRSLCMLPLSMIPPPPTKILYKNIYWVQVFGMVDSYLILLLYILAVHVDLMTFTNIMEWGGIKILMWVGWVTVCGRRVTPAHRYGGKLSNEKLRRHFKIIKCPCGINFWTPPPPSPLALASWQSHTWTWRQYMFNKLFIWSLWILFSSTNNMSYMCRDFSKQFN